jgi:Spy/CpxP family protein refolding chaperone
MKNKLSKLTMMVLVLAVCGTTVFAQSGDPSQAPPAGPPAGPMLRWHGMGGGSMMGPMMATYLGLSDEQVSQIHSIFSAQRTTMRPSMEQSRTLRQQIHQAAEAATFNQAQVQALASQIAQIEAQMTVARAQMEWKVFNTVLTPDQQSKFQQFQQQMQQRIQNRMSRHTPSS